MEIVEKCRTMLENTRDACFCGPLSKCKHDLSTKQFLMNQWISNFSLLSHNNKQGRVYIAQTLNTKVVVKHLNKPILFAAGKREAIAGLECINSILEDYPFFVKTLLFWYRKSGPYIMTEFVPGTTLKNILPQMELQDFLYILLQLCIGLEVAQDKFEFCHYDLHCDNIIVQKQKITRVLFDQYDCTFLNTLRPIIIDFGMSCGYSVVTNTRFGQSGLEKRGIYNRLQPGYDLYTFLLYSLSWSSGRIKTEIGNILKNFFIHNRDNYLESLEKNASYKTPKKLFEYVIKSYKLNHVVEPRRIFKLNHILSDIESKNSFIEYHYYMNHINTTISEKIPKEILETWIDNDVKFLNTCTNFESLVEKFFKIRFLKLNRKFVVYRDWEKKFQSRLNKYWKEKFDSDVTKRYLSWKMK